MVDIVGREDHLASIEAFLSGRDPRSLVLEGEAGIGKSTLWRAGVEGAHERGFRILSSRAVEAERGLAFVALGDLLDCWLDEVLPALSPPRRHALDAALLLEDSTSEAVDPRALGLAVRDAVQALAASTRLLVAIDDAQWLDAGSAAALAFALRRIGDTPMWLLLAQRSGTVCEHELPLNEALPLYVGPLSVGALHRLLHDRLGRTFARQTLLRIHERSGGNPFFALELARALGSDVDPTQPLPVPRTLAELVRTRIAGLPKPTREALAVAASLGAPPLALLERAGVDRRALDAALAAHVIERDNGSIRFTHPLLSSVLYADLGAERRGVHRRIADVVDDPLVRARHLALATETPDTEVAGLLDDAVRVAGERGAAALAAELAEHAVRLTKPDDGDRRHPRALAAARAHQAAGEWTRAQAIGRELLAGTGPGPQRADVLDLLADFEVDELSVPLLEEAIAEAGGRPDLEVGIRIRLALARRFTSGFRAAFTEARAALAAAEDLDDDGLRVRALSAVAFLGRRGLVPEAPEYAARAREIAVASGDPELVKQSVAVAGQLLIDRGEYEAARASLGRDYDDWRERDEQVAAALLWSLAWLELWTGNFERAADCAERSHELSVQYGVEGHPAPLPRAWIAAYRGRLDLARRIAEHGLALCREQIHVAGPLYPGVLGLADSWGGDPVSAVVRFAEADRLARAMAWTNPHTRPWTADYVEALLELGRVDEATRVLDIWEADATALARPRVLAQVTRCRGLIAAAEGRVVDAGSLLERAVVEHGQLGDRFCRARALLALGVVRRRQRQKSAARRTLEEALAGFVDLGAATWIQRTRAELGSIGGRTREQGLTPAEDRVARLVAEGRTNAEVAAALFLTQRTVAGHLTHIYAKLGVRSRTELARRLS